jgi:hypothetical protein
VLACSTITLEQCGALSNGGDICTAGFSAALDDACSQGSSSAACCSELRALGQPCLQQIGQLASQSSAAAAAL